MDPIDDEPVVLRSPAQFKALGHPVRHRLVNVLRQRPATLRQLAEAMGAAKGTIGYHVRVLQDAGLVRVAESRQVRGGTEQYFALVSRSFQFHEDARGGAEFMINAALAEMLPEGEEKTGTTVLRHLWLTPDEVRALAERLETRDAELATGTPAAGAEAYGLLVSLYRADIPALTPDEG
ncbi:MULTISPECIES: ArsR/SmtB family transcription factor [Kitasatospora]|uniref:DNA-binding transcriptional ArsR family regulator n=2 Tax=Kitasatospora TaxID=2063 RepID=A0ABT1IQB8_9ACTN|nr:winged helix-turn-helix domain-containing protein [Kitasatospora paracochleata]MCP2307111.1 DNA-binding transcriptional ArsR family regulator [Kitasatospora paracochleata]